MTDTQQIADASGADKPSKEPVDAYDSMTGTYAPAVDKMAGAPLLPMEQMPQGPAPSPFTLGPMQPGGRGGE